MIQQILAIDNNITLWIYHSIPRFFLFDWTSQLLHIPTVSFILWVFILVIFHYRKKSIYVILLPLFNLLVAGGIANYIIKNLFVRQRPCVKDIVLSFSCPTDYSFPSAHAATSFAVATSIALLDPPRKFIYYSIALIVSISRVYLGVHYLFDIMGGVAIGVLVSLISTKIVYYNRTYNMKV